MLSLLNTLTTQITCEINNVAWIVSLNEVVCAVDVIIVNLVFLVTLVLIWEI